MSNGKKQIKTGIESSKKITKLDNGPSVEIKPIENEVEAMEEEVVTINKLPNEILIYITTYLEPKDLANLSQVNHIFKLAVDAQQPKYEKFYKRLLEIEPSLLRESPQTNFLKAYHQAYTKVKDCQHEEIRYLTKFHKLKEDTFVIQNDNFVSLVHLAQQSQKLDDVNSWIIKQHININSLSLVLKRLQITRLPKQLFVTEEYANFWKELTVLDIKYNSINSLPLEIGNCQALQQLICNNNNLTSLPATLSNCQALLLLNCRENNLTSLPATLGNCQALEMLFCSENQLTSLPASLAVILGEKWARFMLSKQQRPIFENAPAVAITPAHNAIRRRNYDISGREMQQLNENAIFPTGVKRTRNKLNKGDN
jgi:Leucine-rich repeat (LRR) protein